MKKSKRIGVVLVFLTAFILLNLPMVAAGQYTSVKEPMKQKMLRERIDILRNMIKEPFHRKTLDSPLSFLLNALASILIVLLFPLFIFILRYIFGIRPF